MKLPGQGIPDAFYGRKGRSGRRPASIERQIIEQAKDAWLNEQDREALLKKIESGKYSIWDMYRFKALIGDPKILSRFADKLLPDRWDISGDLNAFLSPEAVKEIIQKMKAERPPL